MPAEAKHGGLSEIPGRPKRVDYAALVRRLIDKSEAGKLPWKATDKHRHFCCALDGDLTLECRRFDPQAGAHYVLL
jgi:hypothetical protein